MWYLTTILPDNNFTWKKLYSDYVSYCDAETETSIPICENQQPHTSKAFSSNIAKRNFFKKTNVISKILDFKGIGKKLEVADFQKKVSENDWVTDRKASDLQFAERALGHNTWVQVFPPPKWKLIGLDI